jgi:protein-arginine kinase activator protein McsA
MTEDEIQRLADLIFDKMMEKQEQLDQEYHDQVRKLYENGYVISNAEDKLGLNDEEKLVGELAKLQTMMMILEDKEEYEKAAVILNKINKINKKLNDGSGKY